MAKLTPAIVRVARRRFIGGESISDLAKDYGVAWSTMRNAVVGRTWADVMESDQ